MSCHNDKNSLGKISGARFSNSVEKLAASFYSNTPLCYIFGVSQLVSDQLEVTWHPKSSDYLTAKVQCLLISTLKFHPNFKLTCSCCWWNVIPWQTRGMDDGGTQRASTNLQATWASWVSRTAPEAQKSAQPLIYLVYHGITLNQPYLRNQMCGWDGLSLTPRPGSKALLHSSVKLTANTKIKYIVWNKILRKQAEIVYHHPHFSGGVKRAKNCFYNLLNLTLQKSES